MSLKSIILLILFALLAVYFAFLNPHETEFYFSQRHSVKMPLVTLFLAFVLLGVLIASLFNWGRQFKTSLRKMGTGLKQKQHESKLKKCDQLYEKGKNALSGGHLQKAQSRFEETLKEFPNHLGALHSLGNIMRMTGHLEKAQELHLHAAQRAPENLEILYGLAKDYNDASLQEKELETLKKIRQLDSQSTLPLYKLRDFHLKTLDPVNAHEVQKRALNLIRNGDEKKKENHRLSMISYINGMQHIEKGNLDTAVSEFKRAIREDQRCLPAHIALGDAYLKLENRKAAIKAWKAGFANTRSPVCMLQIQKTLANDITTMAKIYREAIRDVNGADKDTLVLLLGLLLLDAEEPDEAIKVLESNQPQNSMAHSVLLANAYRKKHNTDLLEKASLSALENARDSIIQFVCSECKAQLPEWQGRCPQCKGWDTINCKSSLNQSAQGR